MKNYSRPSLLLWSITAVVFIVLFISFSYIDTISITRFELGFAESILKGKFTDIYGIAYDSAVYASEHALRGKSLPTYDLPLNIILGLWGIPLYFYHSYTGSVDIADSFVKMLYGKSVILVALIITIFLVYRICRALGLDSKKSLWGAYFYFSSAIVISSVGIVGQCDVIGMIFILSAFLAFIRHEDKKFLILFVIAFPFKMYALFLLLPLMLLREKKISAVIMKLSAVLVVSVLCNLSLLGNTEVLKSKASFSIGMLYRLNQNIIPLLNSKASVFAVIFGLICLYCYFREVSSDDREISLLVSVLAVAGVFISFPSFPYWYIYLAPYLAISAVYAAQDSENIIMLETIGMACLTVSNYFLYWWCCYIGNTANMFLYRLAGNPFFRSDAMTLYKISRHSGLVLLMTNSLYIVSMIDIVYLCYHRKSKHEIPSFSIRSYASYVMSRSFCSSML